MESGKRVGEHQPPFTLSNQRLYFTEGLDNIKIIVKNTSLRTNSYEFLLSDQDHFKLVSSSRSFSLAPGISKPVIVKHITGQHCTLRERHVLQAMVRDSSGVFISFECRCPCYQEKKIQEIVHYPVTLNLHEFDHNVVFEVPLRNLTSQNLKIVFPDLDNKNSNNSSSESQKAFIRLIRNETILLANQTMKLQLQLIMSEYGLLQDKLQFYIMPEEAARRILESGINKNTTFTQSGRNYKSFYSVQLQGFCVSRKLFVKTEAMELVSQIRAEMLTGTEKISYFFIENKYHQDIPYQLQGFFQTQTPEQYASKWNNVSIEFNDPSSCNEQKSNLNICKGVFRKNSTHKIQYRIRVNYTVDDENYVSKYSKIKFEDDSNALRMRNSDYSKKYEEFFAKISIKLNKLKDNRKQLICVSSQDEYSEETLIPFRCTLINPSLRCQLSQSSQSAEQAQIIIFNETKISIPFNFPMNSLYRIINNNYVNDKQMGQSILPANKKSYIKIKWTKEKQRCPVYMQIPSFDLVLWDAKEKQLKQKSFIYLPGSRRRPQTSTNSLIKAKQKQQQKTVQYASNSKQLAKVNSQGSFNFRTSRPASVTANRPFTPVHNTFRNEQSLNKNSTSQPYFGPTNIVSKKITAFKVLPKTYFNRNLQEFVPQVQELGYLIQYQKTLKNTHSKLIFIIQIIGKAFIVLHPYQFYTFDGTMTQFLSSERESFLSNTSVDPDIRYRVYGHPSVYRIRMSDNLEVAEVKENANQKPASSLSQSILKMNEKKHNLLPTYTYQILNREVRMSFRQSKQQFEIVQSVPIKNYSNQPLEVNLISADGEFFKCKEPDGKLVILPEQVGRFRIAFKPENTVMLSMLNREVPKEKGRRAMIRSSLKNYEDSPYTVKKPLKLFINKNVEFITCVGVILEKSCSVKPIKINFTDCKYGSSQITQSMIMTNTSPYRIDFVLECPNEISVKPKNGSIEPKATQNFSILFKPSKKISNFQGLIKIYVGGSHLQIVPVHINVEDPEIYIKENQLVSEENAICGSQTQELNLQMTLINNNPSQSLIEVNLKQTPLSLGYSKNYHSVDSDLVMQNFIRCAQIVEDTHIEVKNSEVSKRNSSKTVNLTKTNNFIEDSRVSRMTQLTENNNKQDEDEVIAQKCSINLAPNSFIIVPLTLRVEQAEAGLNTIKIVNNIATLVGFGQIKSPSIIKFNCSKSLLHISPFKASHQIVLTQSQKTCQIRFKNMSGRAIQLRTKLKQIKQTVEYKQSKKRINTQASKDKSQNQPQITNGSPNEPSIICTYKDVNQFINPEQTVDVVLSFICLDSDKKKVMALYDLSIYVKECNENGQSNLAQLLGESPYYSTKINVIMPEPFIQVLPEVVVMPTVCPNVWSRQSFFLRNNGFKEVFLKIKKPTNIAFEFEYQIVSAQSIKQSASMTPRSRSRPAMNSSTSTRQGSKNNQKTGPKLLQNQLTKIKNLIEIRLSFRSKTKISFHVIVQVQDNLGNTYEVPVVGTCTDSPFFMGQDETGADLHSNNSIFSQSGTSDPSHSDISSSSKSAFNLSSKSLLRRSNLQPADIEDLLFINNWIGSLIPEISNESAFFYVWLTKVENLVKFLQEFKISVQGHKNDQRGKKNIEAIEISNPSRLTFTSVFENLKQQGFQLNSLRIEYLQKGDQVEWLNFMWFFLTKAIISPNIINWITQQANIKQEIEEMSYSFMQKYYHQIVTNLMVSKLGLKRQINNNKSIDWKFLLQNFEPLLSMFKNIESKKHLILAINVLYHKLNSVSKEVLELSEFDFVLNLHNPYRRKVRYFLHCNPKYLTCEQCSNKVMPSQSQHGYGFMIDEGQQLRITFSLRNYAVNSLSLMARNVLDLMDIILFNNIIWDPITVFHIQLKRKQDIIHNVTIQSEINSTQEWVYKFEARMTAEYRVFYEPRPDEEHECLKLLTGQPGFLKKGDVSIIRVLYCPHNMKRTHATVKIVNTMVKEVFNIEGVPIHSSKIEYQKNLKIIQNQLYEQFVLLPWDNMVPIRNPGATAKKEEQKVPTSQSSRQHKKQKGQPEYQIKLYNPENLAEQPNKYTECILLQQVQKVGNKSELKLSFNFKYDKLIRNLELVFQVCNVSNAEAKLIRFIIDVVPKPILISAEIEAEFNQTVIESIRVPNILKSNQTFSVEYRYISPETDIKKVMSSQGNNGTIAGIANMNHSLATIHKGLFEVPKVRNTEVLSFVNAQTQKIEQFITLPVKYSPNENNCTPRYQHIEAGKSIKKSPRSSPQYKQPNADNENILKLPYFYININYSQSMYQITYLFKPNIRKGTKRTRFIPQQQSKDIKHCCLPLKKYSNNSIVVENKNNIPITYEVETDLYEISGNQEITIEPMDIGEYRYDIYCLHLGKKQGSITFRLKMNKDSADFLLEKHLLTNKNQLQFSVTLEISEDAPDPETRAPHPTSKNLTCKTQERGLRIYNEYFEIESTVRKPKLFSILLENLSEKEISYQVRTQCPYLKPQARQGYDRYTITIAGLSEYELQIQYLPYFVGRRETVLTLYNPLQPEITYNLSMLSTENIECIERQMASIGVNRPVEIVIPNPNAGDRSLEKQTELQLQLSCLSFNGIQLPASEWQQHIWLADDNSLPIVQSLQAMKPSEASVLYSDIAKNKLKLRFGTGLDQEQKTIGRNFASRKVYLLFQIGKLLPKYEYSLVLKSQKYGEYSYRVVYTYPQVERMEEKVIYLEPDFHDRMIEADKMGVSAIRFSLPFFNKFDQYLQLKVTNDEKQARLNMLPASQKTASNPYIINQKHSKQGLNQVQVFPYSNQSFNLHLITNPNSVLPSRAQVQIRCVKYQQIMWVYPITIYQVYQSPSRVPVSICGPARSSLLVRLHPMFAFNLSKVRVLMEDKYRKIVENLQGGASEEVVGDEMQIELKVKSDVIRKRVSQLTKDQPGSEQPDSLSKDAIGGSDSLIPMHHSLSGEFVYEVDVQITTACALKNEGYFYIYQLDNNVDSKNISPMISHKYLLEEKPVASSEQQTQSFVQRMPFVIRTDPPKVQTLEFEANVGEKCTIKIKLDRIGKDSQMNSGATGKKVKSLDAPAKIPSDKVKIELHNNKCRQFSAYYNEAEECIEVGYHAQEYSGLKRGRLEIMVSGIHSEYELVGKFPKADKPAPGLKRVSRLTNNEAIEKVVRFKQ